MEMNLIKINERVSFLLSDVSFSSAKSSGPGGQHVNKVETRMVANLPLTAIKGLSERELQLIKKDLALYIVEGAVLRFASQKFRSQYANRQEVIRRLKEKLFIVLKPKKKRIKTKIPKAVKEKRLNDKKKRSELKKQRNIKL